MTSQRSILGARTWSATAVRIALVLVILGLVVLIAGAVASIPGVVYTGGVSLALAVAIGLVGIVGSWFHRQ